MKVSLDNVHASCDTVFEVLFDVERLPSISSQVEATELVRQGNADKVGLKWREKRNYEGRRVQTIVTITSLTRTLDEATGEDAISATYSIDFVKNNFKTRQATQTGSLSAYPTKAVDGKKTCSMEMTVSFVAEGCISGTLVRCCRPGIERYGEKYGLQGLSEFAYEANRRQKEKDLR